MRAMIRAPVLGMQAPSNTAATLSATPVHRDARFAGGTGH